ncbi:RNA-directed DNA polymerase [Patescibacteria group bacterium]|nr:RNA-directed DNA polymerase [Patescibacteria group bacterium]
MGNLTSQIFSNIYLNELDQFIKHTLKIKYYIRYTDDFVIVHHNKTYLLKIKEKISEFLENNLKLSLHPNKVQLRKYKQGTDFLGYVTLPKARVLRTKTKRRISKKLRYRVHQFKKGEINEQKLLQSFNSYLGVLTHANCYGLEQKLRHKFWEWINEA